MAMVFTSFSVFISVLVIGSLLEQSGSRSDLVPRGDVDLPDDPLRLGTGEIDRQQPVGQVGAQNLHAFGEQEGALELPRGNAAMQVLPRLVIALAAADDELAFLERDLELVPGEPRDRERDPQPFRLALGAGDALDIVGRIAVARGFRNAIERLLDLIEAKEERVPERRLTRHGRSPCRRSASFGPADAAPGATAPRRNANMEPRSGPIKSRRRRGGAAPPPPPRGRPRRRRAGSRS